MKPVPSTYLSLWRVSEQNPGWPEIILQHPTRMCIEVPVIIIFEHMQFVAKHEHKPVTILFLDRTASVPL